MINKHTHVQRRRKKRKKEKYLLLLLLFFKFLRLRLPRFPRHLHRRHRIDWDELTWPYGHCFHWRAHFSCASSDRSFDKSLWSRSYTSTVSLPSECTYGISDYRSDEKPKCSKGKIDASVLRPTSYFRTDRTLVLFYCWMRQFVVLPIALLMESFAAELTYLPERRVRRRQAQRDELTHGLKFWWIRMCVFNVDERLKALPQIRQAWGFSDVWMILCRQSVDACRKPLPQT